MIVFATSSIHILASRFLSGISGGALYVIIPLFTSEISDDKIRGRLGSVYVFSVAVGILFAYTCGTFFSYETLPFLFAPFSILFLIGSIVYPDSAHFFVKVLKNSVSTVWHPCWNLLIFVSLSPQEAESSLRFFRGVETNETNEKVTNEFQSIQSLMSIDGLTKVTIKDFSMK